VGGGYVRASGGTIIGRVPRNVTFGTQPQIEARGVFNFAIDTPEGYAGGDIDVTTNADLSAMLDITTTREDASASASQLLRATLRTLTGGVGGRNVLDTDTYEYDFRQSDPDGAVADLVSIDEALSTTLTFDPTRKYLSVELSLFISQSVDTAVGAAGSFGFDADDTFSFARTAFVLPEGFSITSAEANVVDNMWIDSRIAPVPLPAGGLLLITGLAALGGIRRRHCA
jgi:hypothetical protein